MASSLKYVFCLLLASSVSALVHPGMLHTDDDFTRMQSKVDASATPWIIGWDLLIANSHSQPTYTANPLPIVYRGSDGVHAENYGTLYNDVAAAYALALRWKIQDDDEFADAAVAIFNAWSSTLTSIQGDSDAALAAGIYGYEFANAAEIVRSYSGWAAADQVKFQTMLHDVFFSINYDFLNRHDGQTDPDVYFAGWDLCQVASIMSIGIFNDNETMYEYAVDYFKSGVGNGNVHKAIWVTYDVDGETLGQCQESGRDQGHSTLDIGLLGVIAQMAYNQGDDLFAYESNLILAGSEYTAKYNVGYDVPYTEYTNSYPTDEPIISNYSRGSLRPTDELLYAHYHDLKGLDAWYTGLYRDMVNNSTGGAEGGGGNYGSDSGGYDQLGYGTLTFRLSAA
ncbi:hypothetical protein LHYA1_G005836 [Lachnellula hyalina]|uniref:Alginate lyase domain-containing protein n=1 Tax=Lachnellula hyalina TaxID=1316788 RepID=A0A8H8R013_9HELO|nr:uncharacterized protein LHYA1_G005836 [Lachnellula hyalina]TVY24915.1 hypothetical protein LHYA1_G005836 [Lachnellula hyalina]